MAAMVAELGPQYFGFAVDVLESALPNKGYMGHIRGYTLHYLLEGLSKVPLLPGSATSLQLFYMLQKATLHGLSPFMWRVLVLVAESSCLFAYLDKA